jgi:UDP-3-O-[3-hydroxymyristoyl] glucosamine N-acyltransferase
LSGGGEKRGVTLTELARLVGGEVSGDSLYLVSEVKPLAEAGEGSLSFVADYRHLAEAKQSRAGAFIIHEELALPGRNLIRVERPHLALAKILGFLYPKKIEGGISPLAHIDESSLVGEGGSVYPFVHVGRNCRLGKRVVLYPGVVVGDEVEIGDDSVIYPLASIYQGSKIGARVIIHSGAVIGADGFGYVKEGKINVKIPQVGRVVVEDDVEIGANSCVDRATLGETRIGRGVKIDNLVQVAHNVVLGEDCILVGQVGISGSSNIGKEVIFAGQSATVDHIKVGDRVKIAGRAVVTKDIPSGSVVAGFPAVDHKKWLRATALFSRLPEFFDRLRRLEKIAYKEKGGSFPGRKEDE